MLWHILLCQIIAISMANGQCLELDSLLIRYDFIAKDKNALQFPSGKNNWALFLRKCYAEQSNPSADIRILHIGGSHVQGGTFSTTIRRCLGRSFMPSDKPLLPGFFFPYALAGTNTPGNIRVVSPEVWKGVRAVANPDEGHFGIAGLYAYCNTPNTLVSISHLDKDAKEIRFTGVRIYYDIANSTMVPLAYTPSCPVVEILNKELGYLEWQFESELSMLEFLIYSDQNEAYFAIQGIEFLYPSPSVIYHTIGVNGAGTGTFLKCENFNAHAIALKSDLVIFGIGVNDANVPAYRFNGNKFYDRYMKLIEAFRAANPDVAFLFITNNDTWYKKKYANKSNAEAREVFYQLAYDVQGAVWDQYEVMGGLNSIVKWQEAGLAKSDKVHFTTQGYSVMGTLLAAAIQSAIDEFKMYDYSWE